jgi:hypothetical protein
LLSEHADREEHVLFPLAEETLTIAKADEVISKLQQADAVFGFSQRELLLDRADSKGAWIDKRSSARVSGRDCCCAERHAAVRDGWPVLHGRVRVCPLVKQQGRASPAIQRG